MKSDLSFIDNKYPRIDFSLDESDFERDEECEVETSFPLIVSLREMSTNLCLHYAIFEVVSRGMQYWISANTYREYLNGVVFEAKRRDTGDTLVEISYSFLEDVPKNPVYADYYDSSAWFAYLDCILKNVYELGSAEGMTILDIGAHIGMFTKAVVSKGAGKVIAVEPCMQSFNYLKSNVEKIQESKIAKVSTINCAIGGITKKAPRRLFTFKNNSASNTFYSLDSPDQEEVVVLGLGSLLDRAMVDHIDLMKINVEGSEKEIFNSIDKPTLSRIDKMVICYHSREDLEAVTSSLATFGREYRYTTKEQNEDRGIIWTSTSQ